MTAVALNQKSEGVDKALERILSLPRRPPIDCTRHKGPDSKKRWAPEAEALVQEVTARYMRPRLSCACRDRFVKALPDGYVEVFSEPPPSEPPPLPVRVRLVDLLADDPGDENFRRLTTGLRRGEGVTIPGLGHPRCITRFKPAQAWALKEFGEVGGMFGFVSAGGGKCLPAGNEIFDVRSARRRDVSEVGALTVSSLCGDKILEREASCFASGSKQCCSVALADGTEFSASHDHPVLTARGWVDARALVVGDLVAVADSISEPTNPTLASDDEIALVALMLADGGCSTGTPHFTNETPAVISEFKRLSRELCFGYSNRPSRSKANEFSLLGSQGYRSNGRHGTGFRDRWNLYGLAKEKRLHPDLWGLSRRQVGLFVNRFWACDGYVTDKGFEVTLASEKMIDDLKFLLLRLGVRARKRYKSSRCEGVCFDAWRLTVTGVDAVKFCFEVGEILGKEDSFRSIRRKLETTARNTNTDIVPIGKLEFKLICDELGFRRSGFSRRKGNGRPRTALRRLLRPSRGFVSRTRFIRFCEETGYSGYFSRFASKDLRWERVCDNRDIGVLQVFDLSVPVSHNFAVQSGGVIVHNTIIGIEAALALPGCRKAALLIKPDQRLHYRVNYLRLREHFRVPSIVFDDGGAGQGSYTISGAPIVRVIPYSLLSKTESTTFFEQYDFDMVFADEWHLLSNRLSSRTLRFLRFMAKPRSIPKVFGGMSGSTIKKSIKDAAHLGAHSLGLASPYPILNGDVEDFARVIDPSPTPDRKSREALALLRAYGLPNSDEKLFSSGFAGDYGIRDGFRCRVIETPGVVSTASASVDCSISIHEWKAPKMPEPVKKFLAAARRGQRPDGWVFEDAMEVAAMVRNVACGYHYYWAFPKATDDERKKGGLIDEWYERRRQWEKEKRTKRAYGEQHLDSDKLLENAAIRGWQQPSYVGPLPVWPAQTWPAWIEIKDKVYHEDRTKVFDEWLARGAAEWAQEHTGIVWTACRAFGQKIAQLAGIPYHGGGPNAEAEILAETGKRSIVASVRSHGESRDGLQYRFHKQLLLEPFPSSDRWEQFLARLAREGQEADTVETWVNLNVSEMRQAVRNAIRLAEYIEETTPNEQLLLAADIEFDL